MKTALLTLLAIACAACSARVSAASSVVYQQQVVYSTRVHVVYVDMNDRNVRVTVALSKRGRGSSEPAASIVRRTHPAAAITGTFFDTHSLIPTGDIRICGTQIHAGCVGSALCVDRDNKLSIVPAKFRSVEYDSGCETILQAGPTLVENGRIAINPRAEGFRDPRLYHATKKAALGITPTNKLLLVTVNTPVGLSRLAKIIHHLGATQAILLDGGSSTAMYARGRFVSYASRRLTNLLLVYESTESYRMASGELAPTLLSPDQSTETTASLPADGPWYRQLARLTDDSSTGNLPTPGAPAAGADEQPNLVFPHVKNLLRSDDNLK